MTHAVDRSRYLVRRTPAGDVVMSWFDADTDQPMFLIGLSPRQSLRLARLLAKTALRSWLAGGGKK